MLSSQLDSLEMADSLEKTLMLEKTEAEKNREAEDKIDRWYYLLNGHDLGQTPDDGEGQGSLVCCSPRGCKQ